jgi:hypothetical protein
MKKNSFFSAFIEHCNKVSKKEIKTSKKAKKINISDVNKKLDGVNSVLDLMLKKNLN